MTLREAPFRRMKDVGYNQEQWDRARYSIRPEAHGVTHASYGLNYLGRVFFDISDPEVKAWVTDAGSEIWFDAAASGGRVSATDTEIIVAVS